MVSQVVNRPTNKTMKEKDINQKLQLYGILTAFQNGKVPSNDQIDVALNSFMNKDFMRNPSNKLSPEGQALVQDFRKVVEQAKNLILTKNNGNLLQDFVWQTQNLDVNAKAPGAPVDRDSAKQHGNEVAEGLRTLGTLLISNGQFRKLLSDATVLLREMAGDAATKTAGKVAPSQEQLDQIDQPAADNTWHETPNLSASELKGQFKSAVNKNKPLSKQDVQEAAGNAAQAAHPGGSRDPEDVARLAAHDRQQGDYSGVDATSGAQQGVDTLRNRASENIPDETKDRARQTKEKTRQYLQSKMPEERREQTIWRMKKMIVEIQGHPDYNAAINTLLTLAETYAGHASTVGQHAAGTAKGVHSNNTLKDAEADLKELIERFANYTSTDELFESINAIYRNADRDPELKNWFRSMDRYVRKCLQQQGYVLEDAATREWNQLHDQGNFLLRDRYKNHTDRVLDEIKFLADQFENDKMNKQFAQSCQKLFNNLGNDENGKPTFKPHLVKDLSEVIIPGIFENVRYIPIPRIEYSDPMIDVVIENLIIESDNLMPNAVEFASDNYFRWGRKGIANRNKNAVMISVTGVQMDLRDVSFYVKKKSGFPSLSDIGIADILLHGTGFSFKLRVSTADPTDRQNFFKVDRVDVDVQNFDIKLKKSEHKLLFRLVKPIMLKIMRPALQKILGKLIKDKFNELDQMAFSIKQEADKAAQEAKSDPSQAQNIYRRYATAAQNKFSKGKKKTEAATADKKTNLAVTQHDSIFPNVHLPGGISTKATEYRDLATKGVKWESPIFSIGSAGRTTSLPGLGKVSHRQNQTTQGGLRDRDEVLGAGAVGAGVGGVGGATAAHYLQTEPAYVPVTTTAVPVTTTEVPNGATFGKQADQAFNEAEGTYSSTGTLLGRGNPLLAGLAPADKF
ncbi:DNA ligase (ATP) [Pseudogymnoascus destructans]|uniref:Uncharacterized protein n=2 Tax=Pseudogymnoascus destructans TaxID=655981 RepID=L8GD55_PSED2|nr:DNA ligase (ATP) [Pseudogymnoascus destructans]ELR10618.1 hypothetical protein GMDG_04887 [Pseudogymnoascus destructans 20631-21]OAF55596.1 DNA ligase (ATP) [Pseudogymnoascus destructans]